MDKNNMSLISVVMGYLDSKIRNGESVKLLNYGANNYELKTIHNENEIVEVIDSILYKEKIEIKSKYDVFYLMKKGSTHNFVTKTTYDLTNDFNGYLELYVDDKLVSKTALKIDNKINKRSIFDLAICILKNIFVNI